ncbi:hypothetical protein FIV42_21400 [Persicimonas caeni]|jgi:uncharacterized protein YneF (UPF0154 family)|uniref:Uncharacterized protein n=1 Tax=Persicimonas caeni TaxID=2292766 RepID=A0A4Y6PXZ5_PERCE|nr:hypothetical protein [Persicimonas caeni]QDG53208.1 hypothetical protein FIV42_21400 [Persicimonas caeni]QED34430.1 hypothetical protein FRD00_21395 [Persicimonas caeni]
MGMSSAHIFYIPIIFFVGVFAGFFLGRRAAENEARELKKRRARRKAVRDHAKEEQGADETNAAS